MPRDDNDEYRAKSSYQEETSSPQFRKRPDRRPSSPAITGREKQSSYSAGAGSKSYVKRYDRVDQRPFDPKRRNSNYKGFGNPDRANTDRDRFASNPETGYGRNQERKPRVARFGESGSYSRDRRQDSGVYVERKKQYGDKPSYERDRDKSQRSRYMSDTRTDNYQKDGDTGRNTGSGFRKPYAQRTSQQGGKTNTRWDQSRSRHLNDRDDKSEYRGKTSSYGKQSSSYKRPRDPISTHIPSWGSVARHGAREIMMAQPEKVYKDYQRPSGGKSVSYQRKDSNFANKTYGNSEVRNSYKKDFSAEEPFTNSRRDPAEVKHIRKNSASGYNNFYPGSAKHAQIGKSPRRDTSEDKRKTSVSGPRPYTKSSSASSKRFSSELKDMIPDRRLARAESILANATRAYERDRFSEALSLLNSLGKDALSVPEVAELMGLTLYRQGQWSRALKILVNLAEVTGSFDQHPVLMDINRALGRHRQVAGLFEELRQAGVSSDLMAEARIVMAGDLADRGDLKSAIKQMLPTASRPVRNPQMRHLRQWFVLADLYERSGDVPLARDLYKRVLDADPSMADIADRLALLT